MDRDGAGLLQPVQGGGVPWGLVQRKRNQLDWAERECDHAGWYSRTGCGSLVKPPFRCARACPYSLPCVYPKPPSMHVAN
eukprot:2179595-Pyramimonas_sp.AAC.1